jgi:two-component system sensor kinase FixL
MGVGLSISRTIIEAHGGKIWAEAADKNGARFSFTLQQWNRKELDQ